WGDPDLQGIWTSWDNTPLQAPDPADPAAVAAAQAPPREKERASFGGNAGSPVSPRRPGAVVVDPPDGRIPLIRPLEETQQGRRSDVWETHTPWERCITMGIPGPLLASAEGTSSNRAYQILQIPGYVVIYTEQIHESRVVPLDGRPHLNADIRLW